LFIDEDNVFIDEDNVFMDEDNVFMDEDSDLNVDKTLLMNEVRVLNLGKFCSSAGFHDLTSADEVQRPGRECPVGS
jgi:hypothetical protein